MRGWVARSTVTLLALILLPLAPTSAAWHDEEPFLPFHVVHVGFGETTSIVSEGDTAHVIARDGRQWRVDADGASPLAPLAASDIRAVERDGNGRLYVTEWMETYVHDGADRAPFVDMGHGRFGPDGRLYFIEQEDLGDGNYRSIIHAVDHERHATQIAELQGYLYRPTFGPDGTLYAMSVFDGMIHAMDIATGTTAPHAALRTSGIRDLAVDTGGRVYAIGYAGSIIRADAAGAEPVLVARAPSGDEPRLTFVGDALFVANSNAAGYVLIDTDLDGDGTKDLAGFPGFQPFLHVPSPADLVITHVADRPVDVTGIHHEVTITVTNLGGSWVNGGWHAVLKQAAYVGLIGGCIDLDPAFVHGCMDVSFASAHVDHDIAPGETREIIVPWDATLHAGTQKLTAKVNIERIRMESDRTNNEMTFFAHAHVASPVGGV